MSRTTFITIGILLVILAVAAYVAFSIDDSAVQKRNQTPAATALLPEGDETPFVDATGSSVSLEKYFGTPMVVFSWASWCVDCQDVLKAMSILAEEKKDSDVAIIGINRAEDSTTATRFLEPLGVSSHVQIVFDAKDYYFANSGGYAMPEIIVFDKKGNETVHQRGRLDIDEIKRALEQK
jgi:thiol-disulfide isomerase/thioredoxin